MKSWFCCIKELKGNSVGDAEEESLVEFMLQRSFLLLSGGGETIHCNCPGERIRT